MVNKNVNVRIAGESDVPYIHEIMQEAFAYYAMQVGISEPGTLGALEETCADISVQLKTKTVFVAEIDGQVVGSVRVERVKEGIAYFSRFGVRKHFKSQGIGCALMKAVDAYMSESDMTRLSLHTATGLLSLVRFYYSKGFVIETTDNKRGYSRALLTKTYEFESELCTEAIL